MRSMRVYKRPNGVTFSWGATIPHPSGPKDPHLSEFIRLVASRVPGFEVRNWSSSRVEILRKDEKVAASVEMLIRDILSKVKKEGFEIETRTS